MVSSVNNRYKENGIPELISLHAALLCDNHGVHFLTVCNYDTSTYPHMSSKDLWMWPLQCARAVA